MSDSVLPHRRQPFRLHRPWDSPGKNTGVGCNFLLQRIFPTQGLNQGFPHCRQILYPAKHAATQSQWLTHLPCPRDTQHRLPPIRTQSQRHTSCHTHAAPGTRRDTQHRRRTKSQGHTRSSRTHSTAQTHNHNDTQHYPNTQHTETQCCPDPCILHDLDPRAHNISGTHNASGHGTHIIAVIHTITMTHSITVTQDCTDTQPY